MICGRRLRNGDNKRPVLRGVNYCRNFEELSTPKQAHRSEAEWYAGLKGIDQASDWEIASSRSSSVNITNSNAPRNGVKDEEIAITFAALPKYSENKNRYQEIQQKIKALIIDVHLRN